ncbi:MAG: hypothetical protein GY725_06740 [bacterium]|nr:hypothetical protein [bacterium]
MDWTQLRGAVGSFAMVAVLVFVTACAEQHFTEVYREGEIDIPDDLYAATAVGPDHLWAAGYFGAIYRTRDGGKSWSKLDSLTSKSIYDISFADQNNGWAVGRRGFVIHTTDGGDTWEKQSIPRKPAQHLFAVRAVTPQIAWAVGDWGGRYYTGDGGKTWEDRSFRVTEEHPTFKYFSDEELARFNAGEPFYDDMFLNDVFFISDKVGWIAGEYGFIFHTEDGGETWARSDIIGDVQFDDFDFPADSAKVPRERWDAIFDAAEILADKPYLKIRIEGFMTASELRKRGDTFLADERADEIREFLEGEGITQDRIKVLNPTPFDAEGIDLPAFQASKTAGRPYASVKVIETPFLFDVKFRDEKAGIVSGLGGVILISEDGGKTFRYRDSDARQALFSAAFADDGRLLAVGEKGLRRISTDSGATWKPLDSDGSEGVFPKGKHGYLRDIVFGEPSIGWMVGQGGHVIKTADGGQTWVQILPPVAEHEAAAHEGAGE